MFNVFKLFFIPEGGNNHDGFLGCKEILDTVEIDFDFVCCAVGTGTTLAGIVSVLKPHQSAIGIAVVNDKSLIERLPSANCQLSFDYVFGGYAKTTNELNDFVKKFNSETGIIIEPIYTGKMFYGVYDLIKKNYFKKGTKILAVHTGGMQYL